MLCTGLCIATDNTDADADTWEPYTNEMWTLFYDQIGTLAL